MKSPGVATLYNFLKTIEKLGDARYTDISESINRGAGYGLVNRYLAYTVKHRLVYVVREFRTRGRYFSKVYALTELGIGLTHILEKVLDDA